MQDGVDVMEDIEAGDRLVLVMALKLLQCPVGDVVSACAVPVVTVEGEALGFFEKVKRWYAVGSQTLKRLG